MPLHRVSESFGGISRLGCEGKMNHRPHQVSAAQQRISNFLYPDGSLEPEALPERFLEFCRHSIESVRGDLLYADSAFAPPLASTDDDCDVGTVELKAVGEDRIIRLEPIPSNRPVVAVDTSTIRIGEFSDGSLCALRGALVVLENNRYRYVRYGPLVFSLGSNSVANLKDFTNLGFTTFSGEPNVDSLLKRIRNALERWLQFNASSLVTNGFILIDGSLTAGTPDNPSRELERILQNARRAGSIVVAISKKTKLRIENQSITDLIEQKAQACLLDVDEAITSQFPPYPVRFLGRVFVGKLARSGFAFRTDVDREIPMSDIVNGMRELTGTDIVDQGYPETLRMAHILATFTGSDVLAIQAFAEARFGVQLIPKLVLRRSLFGPFGTGWEAWH